MKSIVHILILAIFIVGCKQEKPSKPYVHPDQVRKNMEKRMNQSEQIIIKTAQDFEKEEKEWINKITDSCECNNYNGMKTIAIKENGNFNYLLCGYSSEGKVNDSSFLLSGYTLFECNQLKSIIAQGSEINNELIVFEKNGLSIIHQDMFPVKGKKGIHDIPVFKTIFIQMEYDVALDTSFVLKTEGIVTTSLEQFYSEYFLNSNEPFPKQIDPEIELLFEFIKVVKEYPKGLEKFKTLEVNGAATREGYFQLLHYLRLLEK